jgi:hypothetical protein
MTTVSISSNDTVTDPSTGQVISNSISAASLERARFGLYRDAGEDITALTHYAHRQIPGHK